MARTVARRRLSRAVAALSATAVVVAGLSAADVVVAQSAAAASAAAAAKPGGLSAAGLAAREAAVAATDRAQPQMQAGGEEGLFPPEPGTEPAPTPDPAPTPPAEPDPEQVALGAASAAAAAGKKPVEVGALTDEQSLTTANPDGTFTTATSTQPVRFKDDAGAWREVDLSLVPAPGGGQEPASAGPDAASIAASAGADAVVSAGSGQGAMSWRQQDATDVPVVTVAEPAPEDPPAPPAPSAVSKAAVKGALEGAASAAATPNPTAAKPAKVKPKKAKFAKALPGGRDVVVEPTARGAKESVVVPDRASADTHPTYRDVFTVAPGVVAKDVDDSGRAVVFTAGDATVVATFGGGVVTDASTNAVGEPAATPALVRLVSQVGDQVTVEVGADPTWWEDPARAFPMIIDPEWTSATAYSGQAESTDGSWDAYVDSAFPDTAQGHYDAGNLKVGTRDVGGGRLGESQSLVYFDLGELEDSANLVTSAWMSLANTYSSTCTANPVSIVASDGGWNPDYVTWNNRPHGSGWSTSRSFAHGYSGSCAASAWEWFDITPLAQRWSNGPAERQHAGQTNLGVIVYSPSTSTNAYKRFASGENAGSGSQLNVTWENCSRYPDGTGRRVCEPIRSAYEGLDVNLGAPITDTATAPDGRGSFNLFASNGGDASIYSPGPDKPGYAVYGSIYRAWQDAGGVAGWLKYPTSDEYAIDGGRMNTFQGGSISWNAKTSAVTVADAASTTTSPIANRRTARRVPLAASVKDSWRYERDNPVFEYRRGAADDWKSIDLANVTRPDGSALTSWPQLTAAGDTSDGSADSTVLGTPGHVLYWDAGTALAGVGGVLEVRAVFRRNVSGEPVTYPTAAPVAGVVFDPDAGEAATADVGPGSVNLLTGSYGLSATDASAFGVAISRTYQSRVTNAGTKEAAAGAFGGQWLMGGVADGDTADYTQVTQTSATSVDVVQPDLDRVSFTRHATNPSQWIAEPGSSDLVLSGALGDPTMTLTDADGQVTTFAKATGAADATATGGNQAVWTVSGTTPSVKSTAAGAGSGAKTRYRYDVSGTKTRLLRVVAPNPALDAATLDSCLSASLSALAPGCRVLAPTWKDTPTEDGTQPRVVDIKLYASDPATPTAAPTASTLATYTYDARGYLTAVADPRPAAASAYPAQPALTTAYTYANRTGSGDAARPGVLSTITPTGEKPWTLRYEAGGPTWDRSGPGAGGRAVTVARPTLTAGSASAVAGTVTWSLVYGVGVTRAAGGPYDLAQDNTRWWGQDVPPTDAAAVLRPDAPAAAKPASHWAGSESAGATRDYSTAEITYMDVDGRTVNTASPVTGATPAIDSTRYTETGEVTYALSAANRALVMGQDDPAVVAAGGPRASATWASLGLPATAVPVTQTGNVSASALADARTRADQLSTLTQYEKSPTTAVMRPVTTRGPVHRAFAGSGPSGPAGTDVVRSMTVTTYDQGRPEDPKAPVDADGNPTGSAPKAKPSDLATTEVAGTLVKPAGGQSTYQGVGSLADVRTTSTEYDWTLGLPTKVTVAVAGGAPIVRTTTYDTLGRVSTATMPKDAAAGATSTTGVTTTSYYGDSSCSTAPSAALAKVWGGWTCATGPAGAITGAPAGSATTLPSVSSQYGRTGVATKVVETSGSGTSAMVRTTTTGYDAADRIHAVTVAGTGPGWSSGTGSSMSRTTSYTDAGDVDKVTDPGTGKSITSVTDALGRALSTTDASGLTTTTGYDALDRVVTSTQSGTIAGASRSYATTSTYDPTTGQLTGGSDTIAGPSTATYDLEGALVRQSWAGAAGGALVETTLSDTVGTLVRKWWARGSTVLVENTVAENGHSQVVTDALTMPTLATTVAGSARTRRYGYDGEGRLTSTADTRRAIPAGAAAGTAATQQCQVRAWAFDVNSNRVGEAASTPTSGACANTGYATPATTGAGATTHGYDSADQITDTTGGVATRYDAFGRTTQLGATTAGSPATASNPVKAATVGYTVTDMAASQTLYTGTAASGAVEATQAWTLDPTGTRFATSAITAAGSTSTKTFRYDDSSDSPALIDEGNGTTTRPVADLAGSMSATTTIDTAGKVGITWQLANIHGDVVATLANTTTASPAPLPDADEYGKALNAAPTGATTPERYAWLGAKQRSAQNITGLVMMGVRLYNATTGRFLSTDPVLGGNSNAYNYPTDPVNSYDLDGQRLTWKGVGRWAWKYKWDIALVAVSFFPPAAVVAGIARAARLAQVGYRAYKVTRAARLVALNGGKSRVSIEGAAGRMHHDLKGRTHGGVPTPHKTWQPRNARAPHGWGKTQRSAKPMTVRDIRIVKRHLKGRR